MTSAQKGLGRKVLSMRGRGAHVSNELARSARLVADGKGSEGDLNACRAFLGVSRGGGTALKGAARQYSQIVRTGSNIATGVELSAGLANPAAAGRLGLNLVSELDNAVRKNRGLLVKLADSVVGQINRLHYRYSDQTGANVLTGAGGKSIFRVAREAPLDATTGSKAIYALGRAARMGGALGLAAGVGYGLASTYFSQQKAAGDAGQAANQSWFGFGNKQGAANLEAEAGRQARSENLVTASLARSGVPILGEHYRNAMAERTANRFRELVATRETERGLVTQSGRGGRAIAKAAAALGLTGDQLSNRSRNETLDAVAEAQFAPNPAELAAYSSNQYNLLTWYQRAAYDITEGAGFESKWRNEARERAREREQNRLAGKKAAADAAWHNLGPYGQMKVQREREIEGAALAAHRSRHAAVDLD